jgi:2,3-bisphosphoglycerate-independent phosphoglycerate mutase
MRRKRKMGSDGVWLPPSMGVTRKGKLRSNYVALDDRKEVVIDFSAENVEEAKNQIVEWLSTHDPLIHDGLSLRTFVEVEDE